MAPTKTVTIPNVELTLDQLVSAIRQLEPETRSEVARILVETELDARLAELINRLASRKAADDISDADIAAEVNAVRSQRQQQCGVEIWGVERFLAHIGVDQEPHPR